MTWGLRFVVVLMGLIFAAGVGGLMVAYAAVVWGRL